MNKLLPILLAILLSACSNLQFVPPSADTLITITASQALQFGVKDDVTRAAVAQGIYTVASIIDNHGSFFTPEQFSALLKAHLPENQSKALLVIDLTELYRDQYESWLDAPPNEQLDSLKRFANDLKRASNPFISQPPAPL